MVAIITCSWIIKFVGIDYKQNNSEKKLQDAIFVDERAIDLACRFGYSIPNAYKSFRGAKELIEKPEKKKKEVFLRIV